MIEHYVTLFDSLFLPQGVALHRSMERHLQNYKLWVLCVDDGAYDILGKLALPNVALLRLSEVETEELRRVKPSRGKGEFCWTLTPFAPRFVFEKDDSVGRVTYIDSDIWFLRAPSPIFRELETSGKSVLITEHGYSHEFDYTHSSGRFCVQFMTFVRGSSEVVRSWWEERCIDWCFARLEDGKFGDQMYLNDWPERFKSETHVLADAGLTLAPWNVTRFPYGNAVLYHFHGLRLLPNKKVLLGRPTLPIPESVLKFVYQPYVADLRASIRMLEDAGWKYMHQGSHPSFAERMKVVGYNVLRLMEKFGRTRIATLEG